MSHCTEVRHIRIDLPPMPKARPRLSKWGAYMPPEYQKWMRAAVSLIKGQWRHDPLDIVSKLKIDFQGGSARSDLDNDVGSVFDALTKAGVIKNDNKNVISNFSASWSRSEMDRIDVYLHINVQEGV